MAKNPYIHPDFTRLTAVRLYKTATAPLTLKVETEDLLDGTIYQGGAQVNSRQLPPRSLAAGETVTVSCDVETQGLIGVMKPKWEIVICPAGLMIGLGTYCPMDKTNDAGTIPINRRLYWDPATTNAPAPETTIRIELSSQGDLTITSRGLKQTYRLAPTATTADELHLILMTRPAEGGKITLPACGGQPATELKL